MKCFSNINFVMHNHKLMWLVFLTGSHNKIKDSSSNLQHMSESKTLLIDLSPESETLTENGNSWVSKYKNCEILSFCSSETVECSLLSYVLVTTTKIHF